MKLSNRHITQPLSLQSQRIRRATHKFWISPITALRSSLAVVARHAATFAFLLCVAFPVAAQTAAPSKFIQTFLVYYGGGPTLVASDAPKLAKFDLLDIDRFRYNQLTPGTWSA
ncbi:MAG TPA: hypothetical protein VK572_08315, partial [Burkholderiales bacterium]|nr:hypothetical protein [Burkholderiales bacterium]